jgi:hypothetical protein
MSAPRYRTATAPLTGYGHELSHGPAVRVWDAARLGESVQSRRRRSGLARPSDPACGCRDWLACLAAKRATPCSVLVTPLRAAVLHGSRSGPVIPPPAPTGPSGEAMIHMSGSTSSFTKAGSNFPPDQLVTCSHITIIPRRADELRRTVLVGATDSWSRVYL